MKEYKIIKRGAGAWRRSSDAELEEIINQHAKGGWEVKVAIGNNVGTISQIILERDKNR